MDKQVLETAYAIVEDGEQIDINLFDSYSDTSLFSTIGMVTENYVWGGTTYARHKVKRLKITIELEDVDDSELDMHKAEQCLTRWDQYVSAIRDRENNGLTVSDVQRSRYYECLALADYFRRRFSL